MSTVSKMKNKNGYTVIELLILIVILGIAAILITEHITNSIKIDTQSAYDASIKSILAKSKEYGLANIEDVKASETGISVSVNRLVEDGYVSADKNGKVSNPKNDKTNLNDLKILIKYDEDNDTIITELVE